MRKRASRGVFRLNTRIKLKEGLCVTRRKLIPHFLPSQPGPSVGPWLGPRGAFVKQDQPSWLSSQLVMHNIGIRPWRWGNCLCMQQLQMDVTSCHGGELGVCIAEHDSVMDTCRQQLSVSYLVQWWPGIVRAAVYGFAHALYCTIECQTSSVGSRL
jgi:hypothetical protein